MNLSEIYKQQEQEKETFSALRDKTWSDMKQRHENLIAAFQSKENLPEGYADAIDKEVNNFNTEWSAPEGTKYRTMVLEHEKQIEAATKFLQPANDRANIKETRAANQSSQYARSLSSTKEIAREEKGVGRTKDFEQNKEDIDLDR